MEVKFWIYIKIQFGYVFKCVYKKTIKIRPPKMNMYRQYFYFNLFIDLLFSYNVKIKVNEYEKLKLPKINLQS